MATPEQIEAQKELIAHAFSQAHAYTNLVLSAGYAGFFAIWSFLTPELTKAEVFWSALLVSISLSVFILWEVYQSYYRSRSMLSLAKTVEHPSRFEEALEEHRRSERTRIVNLKNWWVASLVLSVVPAFAGVLILLWAFVRSIYTLYAA